MPLNELQARNGGGGRMFGLKLIDDLRSTPLP